MSACIVFDIDGTLADCSQRLHHIQKSPPDWDSFFAETEKDEPIAEMCGLAFTLMRVRVLILFCTGRPEKTREATVRWLAGCALMPNLEDDGKRVFMRKDGDHRPDDVVKAELLEEMKDEGYEPIMVFEDRKRVVDMWRSKGIRCCQVAPGDY